MDNKVIGVTMKFEAGVAPEPLVCWGGGSYLSSGGPYRTRTCDLMRVKHAL